MAADVLSKRIIFENDHVEALCILYKRDEDFKTMHEIARQLSSLIDSIIRGSKYANASSFHDLRNGLYQQMPRWVIKWIPGAGKFYTYATRCIQHGCLSYINRESSYRGRFINTDAPFEVLNPEASTYSSRFDTADDLAFLKKIADIPCRWHEPHVSEVCRYYVKAIMRNRASARRKQLIETAIEAYQLDQDEAKFLLDWASGSVRAIFLERYSNSVSPLDLILASEKYSHLPDLLQHLGFPTLKKLLAIFAGCTVRFPSLASISKVAKASELAKSSVDTRVMLKDPKFDAAFKLVERSLQNISGGVLEDADLYDSQPVSGYLS